ncbi:MAG: DUF115 domain-containing protein, partial [Myxococcales bacterium]|nr:DUF115 domain-containing protein [Myxococcales bacterium]
MSLRLGAEWLEDPVDPVAGAEAFVRDPRIPRADHVVVFGAGLGYRLANLDAQGVAPVVFEPCPEVLELARRHGPGIPEGTQVFTDPNAFYGHLLSVSKPDQNTLLLCPPPYRRAFPEAFEHLSRRIAEVQGMAILRRNSIADRAAPMAEQAVRNLSRVSGLRSASDVGGALAGTPAFIVSAGPSLDKNRHLLAEAGRRGAIFTVNTAAPAVAAAGAPIDLLVAIEVLDVSKAITMAAPHIRALALDITSGGANYDVAIEPKIVFGPDTQAFRPLLDDLGVAPLGYGGSVATAAFSLAAALGADPIVMVGQDLAYPNGRAYATDTLFDATTVSREGDLLIIQRAAAWEEITRAGGLRVPSKARPCVDVPAWGGGTVPSTHELVSFLRWFEHAARELR